MAPATRMRCGSASRAAVAALMSRPTELGGFSLGIQTNGTLWAWGLNHTGQLGIGSTTLSRIPVQVGSQSNWVQVEAGATHTLALQRDGSLWAWGANESGQLGRGNTAASATPVRVGGESAWVEIRAGGFFVSLGALTAQSGAGARTPRTSWA